MDMEHSADAKSRQRFVSGSLKIPQPVDDCGSLTVMSQFAALWNAGRVQGIREERARRKRKTLTAEQ